MLVVAVVFLIIGGVSTAVRLSEICNDDYCFDYYTVLILSSVVSISLSELDSSPLFGIITPKRRESGFVRLCITLYTMVLCTAFQICTFLGAYMTMIAIILSAVKRHKTDNPEERPMLN